MSKERLQPPKSSIRDSWNGFLTELHLDRLDINPNLLTEAGIASGIAAGFAISQGKFKTALGLLATSGFFDAIDGFVARIQNKSSEWGAFLDSVGDRVVDLALLTGISHWAKKQGWTRVETLAQKTRTAALNVSLTRAVAESEGITDLKEQSLGSRLPRLLTITALCLFPKERAWEAGLGFLAVASGVTGIERTAKMLTSDQPYPKDQLSKKRRNMLRKLATTYLRWIGTASLKDEAREKRFTDLSLLMADLGMASDYAAIKASLVTKDQWTPNWLKALAPGLISLAQGFNRPPKEVETPLRQQAETHKRTLPEKVKGYVKSHPDQITAAVILAVLGGIAVTDIAGSMKKVYGYQPPKPK